MAEKEAELEMIRIKRVRRAEAAKRNRKKSPEEKEFSSIIRSSNRRLTSQEYQDSITFNRIIKKGIAQGVYGEYHFFSFFNKGVTQLKNYSPFISDCEKCDLNPDAVAQHVVSRGEAKLNSVFKNGLIFTFGKDTLALMNEVIFSNEELDLKCYAPKRHPSMADAQ